MVNGGSTREGRVEICYNNVYGTICDDQWGLLDAVVTCRQLGFSDAGMHLLSSFVAVVIINLFSFTGPEVYGQAYFGEGQGAIYKEDVQCNGSESFLEDCPASAVGIHDCTHSEDAGVRCQGMCVFGLNCGVQTKV